MATQYKPQTAKARSWDEIEKHYIDLINYGLGYGRLLDLVKHIKSTRLQDRLFAYTSMHKLVISIYNPIEWNRESLHIEFDNHNQKWYFKYLSRPDDKIEFERQYPADIGIEKFDKFISMIKW